MLLATLLPTLLPLLLLQGDGRWCADAAAPCNAIAPRANARQRSRTRCRGENFSMGIPSKKWDCTAVPQTGVSNATSERPSAWPQMNTKERKKNRSKGGMDGDTPARASGPSPSYPALPRSAADRLEAPLMSGQMNSAQERGIRRGAQIGRPALPSCRRVHIPMRERSPVPCAQPSPRGDAPSPLAFAKSCKGGDVSVLDPALAWDVRLAFVYSALCLFVLLAH